jgi:hypothetical protein
MQGYEVRHEQIEMSEAIESAIHHSEQLIVEAGTGIGKSFAYLVPLAEHALENNVLGIVSTNTISLQEQIIHKDIPFLEKALDKDFKAVLVKGRNNYLCLRRLHRSEFQQKDLFEFKLYALQRRTDIADNETKQIELTSASQVHARKVFIYDGVGDQWRYWMNNTSYRSQGSFGQQSNTKVGVFVTFRNGDQEGLGIPLPKGKVRVYKRDDDGKEQFVGEDEIDHTPKDEEVRLYLGNAFDIVGERAQKDFRTFANGHVIEETFEVKVRNHKTETAEVQVYEHPWRWSQWEIVRSSVPWEKVDQSTVRFPLKLKKDEERLVTYVIRYSW